jgi:hypothetical protein
MGRTLATDEAVPVHGQRALSYQRALATFIRIVDESDSAPGLLQHATAQVARITHIKNVKILRYRPDLGEPPKEAGVGWKPGVVGPVSLRMKLLHPALS